MSTVYGGHIFGPPNPNDPSLRGKGRGLTYQGNLDSLTLGAVLVGPASSPFPGPYSTSTGGDFTVTVYCPPGVSPCNAQLPAGSVYTYVLKVTPGYAGRGPIDTFRPEFPIRGITGLGIGAAQAIATAPDPNVGPYAFCETTGHIAWRFPSTQLPSWTSGEVLVFYYQSTSPPSATPRPYRYYVPEGTGSATGPGPEDGIPGACDALP